MSLRLSTPSAGGTLVTWPRCGHASSAATWELEGSRALNGVAVIQMKLALQNTSFITLSTMSILSLSTPANSLTLV